MEFIDIATIMVLGLSLCQLETEAQQDTVPKFCGKNPADIIFIMDSSGSIGVGDFERQKDFVNGMVDLFDIDSGKIRVGVVSYSNWAFLEFNLNTFNKKNKIKEAIDKVTHFKGDTNTGSTIAYMRDVMFQKHNGARDQVPHIAIILTDGRSNDPLYTMKEAAKAKKMGVTMFAIGVGEDVAKYELTSIASDPDKNFVFRVGDYVALQYIKELLAIKTCEVPPPPPKKYVTTPQPELEPIMACKDTEIADIVFATSPASAPENADKTLAFFREIVNGLDTDNDRIRIGMVPKYCDTLPDFRINGKHKISHEDVLAKLDRVIESQPNVDDILRYIRKSSFNRYSGSRINAKKIGVLVVDEGDNFYKSKAEAYKAKTLGNIELFVIGVGKHLKKHRLDKIASDPVSEHVFHVDSYDQLPPILHQVENAICPQT